MMLTFLIKPDEEVGSDKHHCEIDCNSCLKVEGFEECCGIRHQKKQRGGQVGGQELIHDASLEHNLHLDAIRDEFRIKVVKRPTLLKLCSQ